MRCRSLIRLCVGLFIAALATAPASAQSDEPIAYGECCLPLLRPIGARALALSGTHTARAGTDLYTNPAGLARIRNDEVVVHTGTTAVDRATTLSLVLGTASGTFAATFLMVDFGEQDARGPNGELIGSIHVFDQSFKASYATPLAAGLHAGVSYFVYQFRQDCQGLCGVQSFSGTTHGLDVGVQYAPRVLPALELGAAVVHAGFPLQVFNRAQAAPTPTRLRVGAAYETLHHFTADSTTQLFLLTNVTAPVRGDASAGFGIGAELELDRTIFLRASYGSGEGLAAGGAAMGVGIRYDRFDVGIGKSFVSSPLEDQEPFQISFAVRF